MSSMQDQYQQRVLDHHLSGYFTRWFDKINNAKLITVANYYQYVPAFTAMIAESNGDMSLFYETVKALSEQDKASRDKVLKQY